MGIYKTARVPPRLTDLTSISCGAISALNAIERKSESNSVPKIADWDRAVWDDEEAAKVRFGLFSFYVPSSSHLILCSFIFTFLFIFYFIVFCDDIICHDFYQSPSFLLLLSLVFEFSVSLFSSVVSGAISLYVECSQSSRENRSNEIRQR